MPFIVGYYGLHRLQQCTCWEKAVSSFENSGSLEQIRIWILPYLIGPSRLVSEFKTTFLFYADRMLKYRQTPSPTSFFLKRCSSLNYVLVTLLKIVGDMSKLGIRVMMNSNLQFWHCMGPKKIRFPLLSKVPPLCQTATHKRIYLCALYMLSFSYVYLRQIFAK